MLTVSIARKTRRWMAVVILLSLGSTSVLAKDPPRPNIVLIMTDDQGYAPIGRLGHPWIRTPSLDAL